MDFNSNIVLTGCLCYTVGMFGTFAVWGLWRGVKWVVGKIKGEK